MTVSVAFAIAFSSFFLEDDDALAFQVGEYFAYDFCTFYGGGAHFYGAVVIDQQYFVEFDSGALLCCQTVNEQPATGFGFELLSLNFYNYVHLL